MNGEMKILAFGGVAIAMCAILLLLRAQDDLASAKEDAKFWRDAALMCEKVRAHEQ